MYDELLHFLYGILPENEGLMFVFQREIKQKGAKIPPLPQHHIQEIITL